MTVAIVTDSCSDMTPEQLREYDIVQVPLTVFFGEEHVLSPDDLSPEEFWRRVTAPGTPFPHTAAPSAGQFQAAFEKLFAGGADEIVYVGMAEGLSTTINSARMAAEMLPDRTILTVDSGSASMGIGAMAILASNLAKQGRGADEIVEEVERARKQLDAYLALDTLEFLHKGGRISATKALLGGMLSIKPIARVADGEITVLEQVRTRGKAVERVTQILSARPLKELHVLYSPPADGPAFRDAILERLPGPPPELATAQILGPVVGTHTGPGIHGANILLREPQE